MMRQPILGDFANECDNVDVKNIDILEDDGTVGNTIVATEWFAELCFAGWWAVNPDWLAAQVVPEPEPEQPEPDPAPDPAPLPAAGE
jgi:hypothetical protein